MMLGVFCFARIILGEKIKIPKIKLLLLICVVSIFHTIMYLNLEGMIKTILMCLINTYLCSYSFKVSISKSILITFIYMILLIIPDAIELVIATKLLGISEMYYYKVYAGSALGNLSICIPFVILTYFIRKPLRKILNTQVEDNKKIIIYLILTFICIAIVFYQAFSNIKFSLDLIVSIFVMLAFLTILFGLMKQTLENTKLTNKYDKLLEYMITFEQEIERQRTLRHEIKNEFRTIRAKICDKQENKEIIEYIDEIVNDKYEIKQEAYAKFGYLPPNGIKGLCYFKTQEAEDKGIKVSINISKRVEKTAIFDLNIKQQRDFGRMLGVILDNAIEASINSEKKQIGIEVYANTNKECKIIISNTYSNEIDKQKIGKEVFSTKGKDRGHGILLVKQLTKNSNIFEVKTDIQKKIYVQTIIIKGKIKKDVSN